MQETEIIQEGNSPPAAPETPPGETAFGLNATVLKLLAIVCMTIDHIAWLFVPTATVQGQVMHFFGRATIPIMCFFISEGYHHTKSYVRYLVRLGIFAVISHIPFPLFEGKSLSYRGTESVIANLALCLIAVGIVNYKPGDKGFMAFKVPLIVLLLYFAAKCDWGVNAVYFTLAFELARDAGRKRQLLAYSIVVLVYLFPTYSMAFDSISFFVSRLYQFGLFLPVPFLLMYNGKRGGGSSSVLRVVNKWLFYVYYPSHLLILYWIWRMNNAA